MALIYRPGQENSPGVTSNPATKDTTVSLDIQATSVSAIETQQLSGLVGYIHDRYNRSLTARRPYETRWIEAWQNFRGLYGPAVAFREDEKSRTFIKVTKTKALAALGQIIDVLLADSKFPIGIEPPKIPEGLADTIHVETNPQVEQATSELFEGQDAPLTVGYGWPGDGKELVPGATLKDLMGPDTAKMLANEKPRPGPASGLPGSSQIEPALLSAKKLERKIQRQLDECSATKHLRIAAFECVVFGTGIMKGPLALNKEYPKWTKDDATGQGKYTPEIKTIPLVESSSLWGMYPDVDAFNSGQMSYCVQRHRMSRSDLRSLKRRPFFSAEAIEKVVNSGYNYNRLWWEPIIQDMPMVPAVERFEVLEYWGMVDAQIAAQQGLVIPEEYADQDEVQVNCWVCGNEIIRLVLNPFTPHRIPYHFVPYEIQPYAIWGIGLCENMADTQLLMNGFMRMAVDNGVLSGNVILEVDETALVPGQDMTLYPGKIFKKNSGVQGQTIFATEIPNVAEANLKMFDKARELADESTGVMSITHGNAGIGPNLGRTSSGISMVMGAAAGNIRTIIKNFDDYLLQPLGESMFAFNMQFDFDESIKGNLEVVARGTDSLMRNEVRSQRLTSFIQICSNPQLAPFARWNYLLGEVASSLDLDPDKSTNTTYEAMKQAAMFAQFQQQMQQQAQQGPPGQPGQPGQPQPGNPGQMSPNGPNPAPNPNGNGNSTIGTGQAPGPGEQGFSAAKSPPGQGPAR